MYRFALVVIVLLLAACGEPELTYPKRQMPDELRQDEAGLAEAAVRFREKCAYCHGHTSEGRGERADFFQPPAPDFYESRYRGTDPAYLFWRISEGKTVEPFLSRGSVMPAWGAHFSDREIWLLVAFLQQRAGL